MNIAGRFSPAQQEMLAEAGFEPCFVRDIVEGQTIAIDHQVNREAPTEMVVTNLWESYSSSYIVRHWVGVLTTGRKVHCTYGVGFETWKQS